MPIFGAAYAAPNIGTTIFILIQVFINSAKSIENSRIQGLFKAFEQFSSTFQGRFNFQGLFKKALSIQVLSKPVRANPVSHLCLDYVLHLLASVFCRLAIIQTVELFFF